MAAHLLSGLASVRFTPNAVYALTLWIACLSLPLQALAQDGPMPEGPMNSASEVTLGLGLANGPAYMGSDERKTRALPLIAARWRDGWFAGVAGVGYRFGEGGALSWGPRLTLDQGRQEDAATALRGMGDITLRPELGVFANYKLWPGASLGSAIRFGSGNGRDGVLVDLSLRSVLPLSPSLRLAGGLSAHWANAQAMQSQFGVDAAQSARSGYALYSPTSGLRDVGLQLMGLWDIQAGTTLMLGVNTRSLLGDAKDSPLTRQRTGWGALATLGFKF